MTQSASTKPYSDQAVITLVIAAREAWERDGASGDDLDKALEPFASLVPYENEPTTERGWA